MNKIKQKLLVERVRKGDSQAFGAIYDEYLTKIYRYIFLKVPGQEIAQDLSQEVFLSLLDYLKKTSQEIEELQGLIYRIARSKVADYYQRLAAKDKNLELIENLEPTIIDQTLKEGVDLMAKVDKKIEVELVMEQIKKIKNKEYQELIILRFIEDLSFNQISQLMNKKVNALRVMLFRALEELREIIANKIK